MTLLVSRDVSATLFGGHVTCCDGTGHKGTKPVLLWSEAHSSALPLRFPTALFLTGTFPRLSVLGWRVLPRAWNREAAVTHAFLILRLLGLHASLTPESLAAAAPHAALLQASFTCHHL